MFLIGDVVNHTETHQGSLPQLHHQEEQKLPNPAVVSAVFSSPLGWKGAVLCHGTQFVIRSQKLSDDSLAAAALAIHGTLHVATKLQADGAVCFLESVGIHPRTPVAVC